MSNLEQEYILLFYKEINVVGATSCVGTKETVATLGKILANSTGDYLPNNGIYDRVGWVKSTNIDTILEKAILETEKNTDIGDYYDNDNTK